MVFFFVHILLQCYHLWQKPNLHYSPLIWIENVSIPSWSIYTCVNPDQNLFQEAKGNSVEFGGFDRH